MQKEPKSIIISKLRERGCRITRQRRIILDIILDEDCSCCKEIYYKACKQDPSIGAATVYRMVNTLEEIGVISGKTCTNIPVMKMTKKWNVFPVAEWNSMMARSFSFPTESFVSLNLWTGELRLYDWKKNRKVYEIIPDRLPKLRDSF